VAKVGGAVVFAFEGLPGFKDALDRASKDIRQAVSALMEDTAYAVQADARANVRAMTRGDGDLERAIIVVGTKGGTNWRIGLSDVTIAARGGDRVHQRPFIYGFILEHGSRKQPAEPFMRPAADGHLARFQSRLSSVGVVI
jgi:hypothetical protein